jgi:hypothetical protein
MPLTERYLGSISPTYLQEAFTPEAPKSIRIHSNCQYLFLLLGSTGAKDAHIMLMKLTPRYLLEKWFKCLECTYNKFG